jgi:dodecin
MASPKHCWRNRKTGLSWQFGKRADAKDRPARKGGRAMVESVYKVVEIIGTSPESWEKAARAAVETASKSLRDLRIAEVVEQDVVISGGKVEAYRTKLKLSFKYEGDS